METIKMEEAKLINDFYGHENFVMAGEIMDWNHLMLIVIKIEDVTSERKEVGNLLSRWTYWYNQFDGRVNTDIQVTKPVVVEFIKWYNSQKPS
jgi:hypothetical protein